MQNSEDRRIENMFTTVFVTSPKRANDSHPQRCGKSICALFDFFTFLDYFSHINVVGQAHFY